ncbi:MAG: efflux RND transporter periplasmic adaptor subunit [Halieaceae bacterium]|nr:efflux RND transporter periplasmic adaptor subunit [Halieaceae bacterium]
MNRKIILPMVFVALGALTAAVLILNPKQLSEASLDRVPPKVSVTSAVLVDEPLIIDSQGTIMPAHRIILAAEVAGRVSSISEKFQRGGSFEQDEILFTIDKTDARLALERAKANYNTARIDLEIVRSDYKRASQLKQQNLISDQALEQTQLLLARTEAQEKSTAIALKEAELQLERTSVKAPFNGRIEDESIDIGQFINRGEPVAELISLRNYEVRLPIPRDQLAYLDLPFSTNGIIPLHQQPNVLLSGEFAGQEWIRDAKLVRTEALIDRATRQVFAVAQLTIDSDNPDTLLPLGLFVKAEIEGITPKNAYRLPRTSLATGSRILIVDGNNQLRFESVKILRLEHDEVVIQDGLNLDMMICVSAGRTVVDGMHVIPVMAIDR